MHERIRIDDPDDPRIAPYRQIRERDLVGRYGHFLAEGKVVLDMLFSTSRFAAESTLILDSRLAGMQAVLAKAPPGMPVYVADRAVMDAVAGFPMHRGVLAVGLRGTANRLDELLASLPHRAVLPVLIGIGNHDNVGGIFRNAAAFGAAGVVLDAASSDPLYRKAIRVSVGAALKVPFGVAPDAPTIFAGLEAAGFTQIGLTPSGDADIRQIRPAPRTALWLGSEGMGLPAELLARLRTVRIAMAPGFDSLNVATAAAIALHRIAG